MPPRIYTLFLVVLLLAACSSEPTESAAPSPEPPVLCPLTGVETARDFSVERPVLVVKIDNAPPARPQVGLDAADVVYEELGEGGLTRFLSVFHCEDPGEIGPIRSARNVDIDLLKEYEPALFAYSGANNIVQQEIVNTDWIVDLRHGANGDAYVRAPDRRAPYNLMSTAQDLRAIQAAQDSATGMPPITGLVFNPDLLSQIAAAASTVAEASPEASPISPPPGRAVSFSFSDRNVVRYEWDPGSGAYLRFHGDTPHTLAGGGQVQAENLVIQKVQIAPGTVLDASGSPTMDSNVVGGGEATILRGGRAVIGRWSRPTLDDHTTFVDDTGSPIELVPGSTFIHLVSQARSVTVE